MGFPRQQEQIGGRGVRRVVQGLEHWGIKNVYFHAQCKSKKRIPLAKLGIFEHVILIMGVDSRILERERWRGGRDYCYKMGM